MYKNFNIPMNLFHMIPRPYFFLTARGIVWQFIANVILGNMIPGYLVIVFDFVKFNPSRNNYWTQNMYILVIRKFSSSIE